MKVTGISLQAPKGATGNPSATPELLASCLARYSRSNKGIENILSTVDPADPDKSVDAIFKFVDYGHASISGLTGGIAMAIDDVSMFLAFKIFDLAQLADGQESSTRYIMLSPEGLPDPEFLGIPSSLQREWSETMHDAFSAYRRLYEELDEAARKTPEIVRMPKNTPEKVADRLRKNYALDRARYLIPFATRTNVALVTTARVWSEIIKLLDAEPFPEAVSVAQLLRDELGKYAPRLTRHSHKDTASVTQSRAYWSNCQRAIQKSGCPITHLEDEVFVSIEREAPSFIGDYGSISSAFEGKQNRYSAVGTAARRVMTRFAWNNISIAELRDLNRHRTGYRFSPMIPVGFYLPAEIDRRSVHSVLERYQQLIISLAKHTSGPAFPYAYLLGTQVAFEHSTHLDKLIYEIELRTGMGAHFRYAEHLAKVHAALIERMEEIAPFVQVGTAEPE